MEYWNGGILVYWVEKANIVLIFISDWPSLSKKASSFSTHYSINPLFLHSMVIFYVWPIYP
jgi:hypothetical protein